MNNIAIFLLESNNWNNLDKNPEKSKNIKKFKKNFKKVLTNDYGSDIILFVDTESVKKIKYASMLELADRHV